MKNVISFFGIIAIAVIIIFSMVSCGDMGTLVIVNDTNQTRSFYLLIDGENKGEKTLSPNGKTEFSSNNDFTYNINMLFTGFGATTYFTGSVTKGETVELKFSERPWNFP